MCWEAGIEITSLPGPAACITALTVSGLPTRRFSFEAFLPQDKKQRQEVLEELKKDTRTLILYEAPHRLVKTLEELLKELGNRKITVCRELTKKFEEKQKTTLEQAIAYYEEHEPRGEYVLVIAGKSKEQVRREETARWENLSIPEHVAMYEASGMDRKEAMKAAAKDRGVSKRDIYRELL